MSLLMLASIYTTINLEKHLAVSLLSLIMRCNNLLLDFTSDKTYVDQIRFTLSQTNDQQSQAKHLTVLLFMNFQLVFVYLFIYLFIYLSFYLFVYLFILFVSLY